MSSVVVRPRKEIWFLDTDRDGDGLFESRQRFQATGAGMVSSDAAVHFFSMQQFKHVVQLGVNIDHVATVRQARKTNEPDPVWAAALAELGGADGITIHLREDRRHIQQRDLRMLMESVAVPINLELACADDVLSIACEARPYQATLVPERREEVTTEGGPGCRIPARKGGRRRSAG